jgi:hypothetical protein
MITLCEFHEYILSYYNILDFWNAKNLTLESISYDYGLIISTKMFNLAIFLNTKSSVMSLI